MSDTVEQMCWTVGVGPGESRQYATRIVAWANANGGEARYEPASWWAEPHRHFARITVRTSTGEMAFAAPGDTIVMGDEWIGHVGEEFIGVRAFSVVPTASPVSSVTADGEKR